MTAAATSSDGSAPVLRIALVNMPWAPVNLPSIALTQLRSVVTERFSDRVEVDIHYLNHEFADFFGYEPYREVANTVAATVAGLGDWLFRSEAFPEEPDNTAAYTRRYLRHLPLDRKTIEHLVAARERIGPFLDELIDSYRLDQYDVAGLTSMFIQSVPAFSLARKLKARNPGIVTAMGGANCETSMGRVIASNVPAVDFVFSGPALESFPFFIECLTAGDKDACHRIRGVYSKEKPHSTAEIGEERDIDREVPLDYSGFLSSLQKHWTYEVVKPSLLFETSRGCWWGERSHCTFCGLNGMSMNYRAMRPDLAVSQFNTLFSHTPEISNFKSVDNILPKQYLDDVLPRLRPPRNTSIFYEVKADLSEDNLETLATAGVNEIQPGIEALATSTLKLMGKGTTSFQNIRFLKNCLRYGITPLWNLLIGFPGEMEEVYEKYVTILPSLVHLPPPSGVFPVRFDRFSPYFNEAEKFGLKLKPYDSYRMIYPFSDQELADLAYFFEDRSYGAEYISLTAKWIMPLRERVESWQAAWNNKGGPGNATLAFGDANGRRVVRDTRSGTEQIHDLGKDAIRVLDLLETPLRLPRLAERISDLPENRLKAEIAFLRERDLLFEDNGFYISLPAASVAAPRDRT